MQNKNKKLFKGTYITFRWKLDGKDFEGYALQSRKLKPLGRCLGIIQKVNMINYEQFKMIHF